MKKTLLLIAATMAMQCAMAQDTVTVTVCTRLWKANQPITATTITAFANPAPIPPSWGVLDSTKYCVDYTFITSQYAPNATFSFSASKEQDLPLNGVDIQDAILMTKHILGIDPLPTFGMFAADANKSNSITTFDIVETRKLILGIYQALPNNTIWRFFPDYTLPFVSPTNPFFGNLGSSSLTLGELQALNGDTIVLTGVKTCDVNGDANSLTPFWTPGGDSTAMKLPDIMLEAGVPVIVPISFESTSHIDGMQLEFKGISGTISLDQITADPLSINYITTHTDMAQSNQIRALLFDVNYELTQPPTLYLHLTPNTSISLKAALEIDQSNFHSLLVDNNNQVSRLYLDFSGAVGTQNPSAQNLQILAAQPNPFSDQTQVTFALAESEQVLLEVMDVAGKVLFSEKSMLSAGSHNLTIPGDRISQTGIVLYRITVGQEVVMGKLFHEE